MKKIFLIVFLVIQNFCFGQEENKATIIFSDSTTIDGIGEIKKNKFFFKIEPKDTFTEWDYTSTKGIIFSGYGFSEKYEYIYPDKYSKPIIVQVIDEGFVNLYRKNSLVTHFEKSNNENLPNNSLYTDISSVYYVKRKNEIYATDITFSFKTRALKYFSDCKFLINKINNKTFTSENIIEMINYYNNYCDGEEN